MNFIEYLEYWGVKLESVIFNYAIRAGGKERNIVAINIHPFQRPDTENMWIDVTFIFDDTVTVLRNEAQMIHHAGSFVTNRLSRDFFQLETEDRVFGVDDFSDWVSLYNLG